MAGTLLIVFFLDEGLDVGVADLADVFVASGLANCTHKETKDNQQIAVLKMSSK